MGALPAMRGLFRSAFTDGLTDADRRSGRILAAVAAGILLGGLVGVLVGFAVMAIWAAASGESLAVLAGKMRSAEGGNLSSALLLMSVAVAGNLAAAVTFLAIAARLMGRPVLTFLTIAPRFRWRLMLAGLGLSLIAVAPAILLDRALSPDTGPAPLLAVSAALGPRALYLLACLVFLIPAAAAEEVVFRGWLIRQMAAFTRHPGVLVAVSSVLFAAAHFDFSPGAFFSRTLMGAGFAYMTLRLGGVEFSTGAHAANNILIVLFLEPLTLKQVSTPTPLSSGGLLEDAILAAGYVVITELAARNGRLRRWAGLGASEVSPAGLTAAAAE